MATEDGPVLVLCDWGEVVNGKLYMMGAGWTRIMSDTLTPMAIAVLWKLPWAQANQKMKLRLALMTEDGQEFANPDGDAMKVEGVLEIGRPPGTKVGSSLPSPLIFKIPAIAFPPGGYVFEFFVNDSKEASASFDAVSAGGLP